MSTLQNLPRCPSCKSAWIVRQTRGTLPEDWHCEHCGHNFDEPLKEITEPPTSEPPQFPSKGTLEADIHELRGHSFVSYSLREKVLRVCKVAEESSHAASSHTVAKARLEEAKWWADYHNGSWAGKGCEQCKRIAALEAALSGAEQGGHK